MEPVTSTSWSLRTYLQILRRQRRVLVIVPILVVFFGTLPTILDEARYTSASQVRVTPEAEEGVFDTGEDTNENLPSNLLRELATEVEVLKSSATRAAVLARLGPDAGDFDAPDVRQVGLSEIIEIRISADDPAVAADVANTYADVFIDQRRTDAVEVLVVKANELREQSAEANAQLDRIREQLTDPTTPPLELDALRLRQSTLTAQVQDFDRRADELEVEAELREGGTQLVSLARLNPSATNPSSVRAAAVALLLGVLLAVGVAVLADLVQDRLGSSDDLQEVRAGVPVLATVPHEELRAIDDSGSFALQEAYRYLRTGLRFYGLNARLASVLVTSAVSQEGKSTVAARLARTIAETDERVVLVDCDLRRPSLHEQFDLPNHLGLSSLVLGEATLDEVSHFVQGNLAVITSGPLVNDPAELLSSPAFAEVMGAIIRQADMTILDSPPVLPVADALVAGQVVDGAIVVGRIGMVRRRSLRESLRRIDSAGIPIVGMVANDLPTPAEDVDYSAYAEEQVPDPAPAT